MDLEALPGLDPFPQDLQQQLKDALLSRGSNYHPRTHHLGLEGRPRFTNRLILEESPYLLQHAHNPVSWHPWGAEAFAQARAEDKPVLLSVGYSTCHWCHVMERESFEDEEIARILNTLYVPVKVDREVRPDVDHVYMQAVQALTGGGGWPMTVWLTPDGRPFYGGTYFPPRGGMRGMSIGFRDLLLQIAEVYRRDGARVASSADGLVEAVRRAEVRPRPLGLPGPEAVDEAWRQVAVELDEEHGGFGAPPKFPMPPTLELGLVQHHRSGDAGALAAITLTLSKMAGGGIHDQLAGGFHRYSTDRLWLVPHFEKMLYDQALLTPLYLAAWQVTGDPLYRRIARETLSYVEREMRAPSGAFFAATDADSEGEEGTFFLWTPEQVDALLPSEEARAFKAWYDVRRGGNWEGRSILNNPRPLPAIARELGIPEAEVLRRAEAGRARLYQARLEREAPHRDEKEIVAWSALMARAFALGGMILEEPRWIVVAAEATRALLGEGGGVPRLRGGREPGFLEDLAALASACLTLFEVQGEGGWLEAALRIHGRLAEGYAAPTGGFYATSTDHEALLVRELPVFDGVMPSGNAIAADNLLRLAAWTDAPEQADAALGTVAVAGRYLVDAPRAVPAMAKALARIHAGPRQVIIVTSARDDGAELRAVLRRTFLPFVVQATVPEESIPGLTALAPVFDAKAALGGRATAYVCRGGACELPTSDPETLLDQIRVS